MYNGVGLDTARGSGTNGYVQRNLAHIKVTKDKTSYRSEDDINRMEAILNRPPNEEILEHERRRKIEVKCFELQELMTDQGFPEDEIESKVNEYRQLLTKQMERSDGPTSDVIDDYGRRVASETHQIAELQQEKNLRLRAAFAISDDYIDGSAVSRNKSKANDVKTNKNGQEQEKQKETAVKQQVINLEVEQSKIVEKSKPIKELSETKKSDTEKKRQKSKHKHAESSSSRRRKEEEEAKRRKRKQRSPSTSEDGSVSSSSESSSSSSSDSDESSSGSGSSSDSDNSSSSSSSGSSQSEAPPPKKKKVNHKPAKRSSDRSHKTEKSTKNGRHDRKQDRRSRSPVRKRSSKK